MRADELDFHLPPELIAQTPSPQRAASRLLHYRRSDRSIAHRIFSDLPALLKPGDVLVFNDTRVVPARFMLKKETGGLVEALYLSSTEPGRWRVMLKSLGNADRPQRLRVAGAEDVEVIVASKEADGTYLIAVNPGVEPLDLLNRVGRMPLPPYIKRAKNHDARDAEDRDRYQTVYATIPGSVAAPTAGLHFSDVLLRELDERKIERVSVTLHVALGTFKPVTSHRLEDHLMHEETYSIDQHAADSLNCAKREGCRIVAVGTTAARVIESQSDDAPFAAKSSSTKIFIYPRYDWRHIGALITNFHLPRSTLIALVAAFVGLDEQRRIYREAIDRRYRFFSYGDASFLE